MDNETNERVFVIRMWFQTAPDTEQREWRGSIQDVTAGLRLYVTGTRDIADFIDARLGEHTKAQPPH